MTHTKTYRGQIRFKADADQTGEFTAVFATFNVIDHDGDVTEPGAFEDGQVSIVEPWNHGWTLPVGRGVIHQDEEKAWIEGQFFLDTQGGLEHYKVVKALDDMQEWSYTFNIEDGGHGQFEGEDVYFLRKLDVWGVAPVTRGAGIGTQTMTIKRQKDESGGETSTPDTEPSADNEDEAGDGKSSEVEVMRLRIEIEKAKAD
jgi:HK97 family phage prohead protease